MVNSVCTLFEGQYHFGVAALTNSLCRQGYRGSIYAGYRGSLPKWTDSAKNNHNLLWPGAKTLNIIKGLKLHFLPVDTENHLTNYKPDFMIQLLQGPAKKSEGILYFDPDIIVTGPWTFFSEWIKCGIALCEDVNSPLQEHHPRRVAWRQYFSIKDITLVFKTSLYANGGFIGISKDDFEFLDIWKTIQEIMAPAIGGLNRSSISGMHLPKEVKGPFAPFGKTDQDALNATIEVWKGNISLIGKEGMAFKNGLPIMPHALGQPKPWQRKSIIQALNGKPPRRVDKEYWQYANGPIMTQPISLVYRRQIAIYIAAIIGRFYRRGNG